MFQLDCSNIKKKSRWHVSMASSRPGLAVVFGRKLKEHRYVKPTRNHFTNVVMPALYDIKRALEKDSLQQPSF